MFKCCPSGFSILKGTWKLNGIRNKHPQVLVEQPGLIQAFQNISQHFREASVSVWFMGTRGVLVTFLTAMAESPPKSTKAGFWSWHGRCRRYGSRDAFIHDGGNVWAACSHLEDQEAGLGNHSQGLNLSNDFMSPKTMSPSLDTK